MLVTAAVFVAGKRWPAIEAPIWILFGASITLVLYVQLREPVNYDSIAISADAVEYAASLRTVSIRFDSIVKITVVREEALGGYIESKWSVVTASGDCIDLMDEWPHRRPLLRAFKEHLPGFDASAAKKGLRAWGKEGCWVCFDVSGVEPSSGDDPKIGPLV